MDETTMRRVRIPPETSAYDDKHNVRHLMQSMLTSLVIDQPEDPIGYLIGQLKRSRSDLPSVLVLGPPGVGKHTLAQQLSAELRAVHVTWDGLLRDQSECSTQVLVDAITQRLKETDCFSRGWVLEGIPQTRLQARSLQEAKVLPEHVVMLEAPDDVLLERTQGKLIDPLTGDVYHETFVWPDDDAVAQRLKKEQQPSSLEKQRLADLHRYRCEVTGLRSAYQNVLKVVNADQPPADVYQQVLAFVQTHHRFRNTTPRILLLGPPGSGKSHQARLLSEKYNMVDVSCDELLGSVAADGSSLGQQIRPYLDTERTVPDSLVLQVLEERLSLLDCSCRGWIVHGDMEHTKILHRSQHRPNRVFLLELTDDVCLERICLRATDPVSGERFHAVTRPAPSSDVQNRLQTRPEDRTDAVRHRLSQYRIQSADLQFVFPDAVHVDADQNPHSVFETLESKLTAH
ncbi:adenylate kinase 8 [Symphorus nematophorus]